MKPNELIGKAEGPLLEFKSAEALHEARALARQVVAMLNSSNGKDVGEIWIGVEDKPTRPADLRGVSDAPSERDQLRDKLLGTIEPTPMSEELEVTVEPVDERVSLIRISVLAQEWRKPFAVLFQGKRDYAIRELDRTRTVGYDELRALFRADRQEQDDERSARDYVRRWTATELGGGLSSGCMNVVFAPLSPLRTSLSPEERLALLTEPHRSGNRPEGHTFIARRDEGKHQDTATEVRAGSLGSRTRIEGSGRIRASRTLLEFKDSGPWRPHGPQALNPLALCEYVTSLARLADACARDERPAWCGAVAVIHSSSWVLPPAEPLDRDLWRQELRHNVTNGAIDHIVEPMDFERGEMTRNPDACAWRMLVRLYGHFGLEERHLPREFDPRTRRLRID